MFYSLERFMLNNRLALWFRDRMGEIVSPVMALNGFRFSKEYRHGNSLRHRIVYMLLDTIQANRAAESISRKVKV